MAKQEGYQGWKNYQTFGVGLEIDNTRGLYDYWNDRAQFCKDDCATTEGAIETLADMLQQVHEEHIEYLNLEGFAAHLMQSAFEEVDFREIAEHILEGLDE